MQFNSIRFKTTLLFSGILFIILSIFNAAIFFDVRSIMFKDVDENLRIKAGEISNIFQIYEHIEDISTHPLSILEDLLNRRRVVPKRKLIVDELWRSEFETLKLKKDYINILSGSGQPLLQSTNLSNQIRKLILDKLSFSKNQSYFGSVKDGKHDLRVINLPYFYKKQLPLIIQVATPLAPTHKFLNKLLLFSVMSIAVTLVLTSFLGAFFVRRILRPVITITNTADNVSHKDLSVRVSTQEADVEMQSLIDSFNAMISRLDRSFTHINEFNSYVAHELKTPLAILRGELELASEQMDLDGEHRNIISDCLEETDRMIRIVKDLLLISKLDYQPQILKFEKIDFNTFFKEIYEHSKILASEKDIEVTLDLPQEDQYVSGDKVHLRRLFLNIIMNAVKYTPPKGAIGITVGCNENNILVHIKDTGDGISEENLAKIFDKFFRIDKNEKEPEAGNGLGLSIALSIVRAHQGDIKVTSKLRQGSTFTITLPQSS